MGNLVVFIIIVVLVYQAISTCFWYIVGALTLIALICLIKSDINKAKKEKKRQQETAIRLQQEEKRRKEREVIRIKDEAKKVEAERQKRLHHERVLDARRKGVDVCLTCETIQPTRCKCGKCIASAKCHRYSEKSQECRACNRQRQEEECDRAEKRGEDVCRRCLTVNPGRCLICDCCLSCYGGVLTCHTCGDD